jgi:DNA-binding transcriptional LysR family regulator
MGEHFILREEGSGTRASTEHLFREHGLPLRTSMEMSSNETIKQAVMARMGISLLSAHTIGLELAAEKLVMLNVIGLPVVRDWYAIHLKEKRLAPIAAAFRVFLLQQGAAIIEKTVGPPVSATQLRAQARGRARNA